MNAIAQAAGGTALAALQALKKNIANVQSTLVKSGGEPYLRLLKDGSWVYGQDDVEVEAGSVWAVNPLSIRHGYACWKRGKDPETGKEYSNAGGPLGEAMVSASLPMPDLAGLPDYTKDGGKWVQTFSVSMKCLTGEDKGEQVLYKVNSVGGVDAFDKLLSAIGIQIDENPEKPVPAISLEVDSYKHKEYGKTYTPVLAIKTWVGMSDDLPDIQSDLDGAEADAPQAEPEAPAKRTRAAKASVPKTPAKVEEPAEVDEEEDELERMERLIAEKKAARGAAAKGDTVAVDPAAAEKAARIAAARAALAELEGGAEATETAEAPAAGQPQRRRRA